MSDKKFACRTNFKLYQTFCLVKIFLNVIAWVSALKSYCDKQKQNKKKQQQGFHLSVSLQGSPFLKIITCPTPRILKFFDMLTWNKEEKSVQIRLPDWEFYLPRADWQWETASPAL